MPAKGKSKVSPSQARRVAAKRAAGQTIRDIAKEESLSPSAVSSAARRNAPLIQRLTIKHEAQLEEMYSRALKHLSRDLGSKSAATRHDARQSLLKYVVAAARVQVTIEAPGQFDLQTVMVAWQRIDEAKP